MLKPNQKKFLSAQGSKPKKQQQENRNQEASGANGGSGAEHQLAH